LPRDRHPLALAAPYREPRFAVQAIDAFDVHLLAVAHELQVETSIAPADALRGKGDDPLPELGLRRPS
jgi:hypothetical protein